jgi:succinate dehydrogenase / fumarate reductase, membrane anchor subunit
MDNLQSPLKRARGHGSSHSGVHHWWLQRVSAVALVFLGLWFVFSVSRLGRPEYFTYHAWLQEPQHALPMLGLVLAALYHGRLGLQVILEDYVHCRALTIGSRVLLDLVTVAAMVTGTYAIAAVAFGA